MSYDPSLANLPALVARVERAGYGVASGEAELIIKRLADGADASRLEKKLLALEGVLSARVSFASERAVVRYIPTVVSQAEIRKVVSRAGFETLELGGESARMWKVRRAKPRSATSAGCC